MESYNYFRKSKQWWKNFSNRLESELEAPEVEMPPNSCFNSWKKTGRIGRPTSKPLTMRRRMILSVFSTRSVTVLETQLLKKRQLSEWFSVISVLKNSRSSLAHYAQNTSRLHQMNEKSKEWILKFSPNQTINQARPKDLRRDNLAFDSQTTNAWLIS